MDNGDNNPFSAGRLLKALRRGHENDEPSIDRRTSIDTRRGAWRRKPDKGKNHALSPRGSFCLLQERERGSPRDKSPFLASVERRAIANANYPLSGGVTG